MKPTNNTRTRPFRIFTLEPEILRHYVDMHTVYFSESNVRLTMTLNCKLETPLGSGEFIVIADQRTKEMWEVVFGIVVDEGFSTFGKVIRQSIAVLPLKRFKWRRRKTEKSRKLI